MRVDGIFDECEIVMVMVMKRLGVSRKWPLLSMAQSPLERMGDEEESRRMSVRLIAEGVVSVLGEEQVDCKRYVLVLCK